MTQPGESVEERMVDSSADDGSKASINEKIPMAKIGETLALSETAPRNEDRGDAVPVETTGPTVSTEAGAQEEHHDWHQDDSSFALFNQSFDTISEIGGTSFGLETDDAPQSPSKQARYSHTANGRHHHKEDISTSSEISVGNISPIKLVYSDAARPVPMAPAMHKSRFPSTMGIPPNIPNEWKSEEFRQSHRSNPFFVLRSNRAAFANMKYLLSCLRSTSACPVNMSEKGSIRLYRDKDIIDENEVDSDLLIASRRVDAAICAFGGSVNGSHDRRHHRHQTWSIFRTKGASTEHRRTYEKSLPRRYAVSGSHISWDVEENPPILLGYASNDARDMAGKTTVDERKEGHGQILAASSSGSTGGDSHNDPAKMKYKCKKCGQIKQNHSCPYQEKLQRSIGCSVYPAVNSYTAAEPGVIAPAFTEMNNFVSYDSDHNSPMEEYTARDATAPSRPAGDLHQYTGQPSTISPDSLRGVTFFHSPQSSLSAGSSEETMTMSHSYNLSTGAREVPAHRTATATTTGCKRPHKHLLGHIPTGRQSHFRNVPFVAAVSLRPEHYRSVTPHTNKTEANDCGNPAMTSSEYQYPPIPLTFPERKRLSDTLFFLSKELPSITADCAAALREARRNNEWDLAVAELLTQVVVGLFCGEGDIRLDGLQRYLMALGISC